MSIKRACYVACDKCSYIGPVSCWGAKEARRDAARDEAFRSYGTVDLCPKCQPTEDAPFVQWAVKDPGMSVVAHTSRNSALYTQSMLPGSMLVHRVNGGPWVAGEPAEGRGDG